MRWIVAWRSTIGPTFPVSLEINQTRAQRTTAKRDLVTVAAKHSAL
jgi:hypothetical protein